MDGMNSQLSQPASQLFTYDNIPVDTGAPKNDDLFNIHDAVDGNSGLHGLSTTESATQADLGHTSGERIAEDAVSTMSTFADFPGPASSTSMPLQTFGDPFDAVSRPSPGLASSAFPEARRASSSNPSDRQNGLASSPDGGLGALGGLDFGDTSLDNDGMMGTIPGGGIGGRSNKGNGAQSVKKDEKTDTAPSWTEMKTKAGKERKRLPLACIACRRKKIRCSGEKPACKHCLRSRIPCVYKVTTRKAAPRTDYMAMLDKRLKRMEERVIKIIPKDAVSSVVGSTRAIVKPAIPPPPSKLGQKKRNAEEAFGDNTDEWTKFGKQEGEAQPGLMPPRPQRGGESEESRLLTDGAESLPTRDIQEHLTEVFFDYVYGQAYFLLHKPSFMRRLKAGQVPPVLILSVCAISARFSTHPAVRTEPQFLRGENWAVAARDIALKRYDKPNITILLSYLILGLHAFGTCQGGSSWMFGGMAQRMGYALQLHKELDYENWGRDQEGRSKQPRLSPTDQEIRRRTMWSCYMMDRFTSSGTDRPLFLWEKHIRIRLPMKESSFQLEVASETEDIDGKLIDPNPADEEKRREAKENTGLAGYTVRACAIWGRIVRYMNLGGKEADEHPIWHPESGYSLLLKRAEELKESIPSWYAYNPDNLQVHSSEKIANQFIFLHMFIHQNILFLNRFALPTATGARPSKDMPQDFLTNATKAALDAANKVSALLVDAMDHRVVAPFAGYCAFLSSTVHIHGIFSKNSKIEGPAKKNLAINVKFINKIKRYWGMFHFVAEQLKDQYRQQADFASHGNTTRKSKDGTPIFQYGDWFDRYPNGVSSTDFEDPAAEIKKEPGTDAVMAQGSDVQSVEDFFATLSPTSKQEHQQKLAKKKRHNQSQSSAATSQARHNAHPSQSDPAQPAASQPNLSIQPEILDPLYNTSDIFTQSPYPGIGQADWDALTNQAASGYYPNAARMLSELDRQLVLSSYSGFDTIPTGLTPPDNNADILNAQIGGQTQQQRHNSATEAFLQAQLRAQVQVQAQARLQQQQQQRQAAQAQAAQASPATTQNPDWANWDLSMDATSPSTNFDPSSATGFGGGSFGYGTDVGVTPWFMPFNLQPPDVGMGGTAGGMWDYVFTGLGGNGTASSGHSGPGTAGAGGGGGIGEGTEGDLGLGLGLGEGNGEGAGQ